MTQTNSRAARGGQSTAQAPVDHTPETAPSNERNRPVHEVRIGSIKAAIWENEGSQGAFCNVSFARVYKDRQGGWQTATTFGRDDLLVLGKVADLAHTWICEQAQGGGHEAGEGTG